MKNAQKIKQYNKKRRLARVRARILGTLTVPRLAVFRSLKHINAQLIDDERGATIVSAYDVELKNTKKKNKTEIAKEVGDLLAKKALEKQIKSIVFDRRSYAYHGRVKALALGAREGGLRF